MTKQKFFSLLARSRRKCELMRCRDHIYLRGSFPVADTYMQEVPVQVVAHRYTGSGNHDAEHKQRRDAIVAKYEKWTDEYYTTQETTE